MTNTTELIHVPDQQMLIDDGCFDLNSRGWVGGDYYDDGQSNGVVDALSDQFWPNNPKLSGLSIIDDPETAASISEFTGRSVYGTEVIQWAADNQAIAAIAARSVRIAVQGGKIV